MIEVFLLVRHQWQQQSHASSHETIGQFVLDPVEIQLEKLHKSIFIYLVTPFAGGEDEPIIVTSLHVHVSA